MNIMWFAFAVMAVIAIGFVVLPLLRPPRTQGPARDELNVTVFHQRLAELEADLSNGSLDAEQFQHARTDLEHDLAVNLDQAPATPPRAARRPFIAVVATFIIPIAAFGMYFQLGAWQDVQKLSIHSPAPTDTAASLPPMEELVELLKSRLEQTPENLEGWIMLGRSYQYLSRTDEAVAAYERALTLATEPIPELLLDYAEALAVQNEGTLAGRPAELIEQARLLEPRNPQAIWLSGMTAYQQDAFATAAEHWQNLQALLPPDGEEVATLRSYLADARQKAGIAPMETDVTAAVNTSGILVQVLLAEHLAERVNASDTLFVYAKAQQGPPMPLAIVRTTAENFPVTATLDDSSAMMPALKLSNFDTVIIGARISQSGNATPQSGDLQGLLTAVPTRSNESVTVTIDDIVP